MYRSDRKMSIWFNIASFCNVLVKGNVSSHISSKSTFGWISNNKINLPHCRLKIPHWYLNLHYINSDDAKSSFTDRTCEQPAGKMIYHWCLSDRTLDSKPRVWFTKHVSSRKSWHICSSWWCEDWVWLSYPFDVDFTACIPREKEFLSSPKEVFCWWGCGSFLWFGKLQPILTDSYKEKEGFASDSTTKMNGVNLIPRLLIPILGSCLFIKFCLIARGIYDMSVMVLEFPPGPALPILLTVFPAFIFTSSHFLWNSFIRRVKP